MDLGLSVKWASQNVINKSSSYSSYFAWGETETKSVYDNTTYFDDGTPKFSHGGWKGRETIYNDHGGKTRITPTSGHDAPRENWGGSWRLPTTAEFEELSQKCSWKWDSNKKGYKITGPNGNSIFLPALGYVYTSGITERTTETKGFGLEGRYWTSDLHETFQFTSDEKRSYKDLLPENGKSVRAVLD